VSANILILDPIDPGALRALGSRFSVRIALRPSDDELLKLVAGAEVIVLRSGVRLTRAVLGVATSLRLVARAGVGVDNIDLAAARDRGVVVFNVPGENGNAVAEFTFGLVLALVRKIALADRQLRAGRWAKHELTGIELRGKTLGVVGLGEIGGRVSTLGGGFGMRIVGCVAHTSDQRRRELALRGIALADFDEVLTSADVVSLHVPLDAATRGLVGGPQLAKMKASAVLVNVSRGDVVDEAALFEALSSGAIAGAAIDVFAREGQPTPLSSLDNVLLTPHIGAMTADSQARVGARLVESIVLALEGKEIPDRIV
jgi:D-3-phosphoglycerate dehydrogenase